jgi:eukaryotic-like serine/threonine-protein kinase
VLPEGVNRIAREAETRYGSSRVLERIGNCRILSEIASGGMAVVYKAVQESLNRTVAVKALKTSVAADSQFAIRFEREALSLAQLQHENIIHVYDFYKDRGAYFIVMEYVEGIDLYDLLDRCGRLPVDVAAIIAMQVARALDYAHYRGIIHRDIKPANIMTSRPGGVKLMDFGIARDQSFGDLTQTGTGLGTPSYMSPEQILGDKLDFRSDLFSLGIVLYQMCTGRKPFIEDEQKSVMHKIRIERFPNPRKLNPEIPRELERIMAKCMQKLPRDRWRSTQDLVLALERFLSKRVDMNHHARLVLFLKNTGVISAEEAEQLLQPSAGGIGVATASPRAAFRPVVRRVASVQATIAGALALAVGLLHIARTPAPPRADASTLPIIDPAKPLGHLRVVAEPWAEIWIDGKLAETTPFATPIPLEAGAHKVVLKNPYFADSERGVQIEEGAAGAPLIVQLHGKKPGERPANGKPTIEQPAAPAPPPIVHTVRPGDTLEVLAAEYYGKRDFAVFIMLANDILHPRALKKGDKLTIPTAWKYRVVPGDTLSEIAERYLGDSRRAEFLAAFNSLTTDATLMPDDELTIPFHAVHAAQDREEISSVAAAFYRDPSRGDMLRRYNFRSNGKPLKKGETLIVPIVDVHARLPVDQGLERREERRRAMTQRGREALERAQAAWRTGDYAGVKTALLVDIDLDFVEADVAANMSFLLGSAYVAFGDRDSAVAQLKRARDRRPALVVRADEQSPKICEVWTAVGGTVEEPR